VRHKSARIAKVLGTVPLNISFRRALVGQNLTLRYNLVARILHVKLSTDRDTFQWRLTKSGQFSVQSMYRSLINNGKVFHHKEIWKLKLPLKIKIFMWYLLKGVVLTKDNLAKRNWQGSSKCGFCILDETNQHLFIDCHYAHFMWRLISICFGFPGPISVRLGVKLNTKNLILTGVSALC
jgi:hypothetical protein